jgi:hypothetical protein
VIFAMVFKCFSGVFVSISNACFKCFICLLLYVASVVSEFSKVDQGVANGMCVGSRRGASDPRASDVWGGVGLLLGRSLASPMLLGALALQTPCDASAPVWTSKKAA